MYRKGTVISDVLTPSLVTVMIDDTLHTAINKLHKFNLISLPVTDTERKFYIGGLAVWDIANLLVQNPDLSSLETKISDHWPKTVGETREDEKALKYGPGGLESIYSFSINTPLDVLINTFGNGVHRVLLTSWADGREIVLRNFSQSDLLRAFYCMDDLLMDEFKNKTLDELKAIKRPVVTVKMSQNLGFTLKMMMENKISALAVLDENDRIKTTFSLSDLRGLDDRLLRGMNSMTVGEYLAEVYSKIRPPVLINRSDTLEETLRRMTRRRIHRLWEVDKDSSTVTGVVSLTDIMRVLSNGSSKVE